MPTLLFQYLQEYDESARDVTMKIMELDYMVKLKLDTLSNEGIEQLIRSHFQSIITQNDSISPDLIEEITMQSQGFKF